jgi:hypothetical protein
MKLLLECVIGFALGFGCAAFFDALGVNFYVGFVLTVAIIFLLVQCWERLAQANNLEAFQRQRSAIATYARERLQRLDPPLPKEHYRTAFRRLCRAIANGRKRVRIAAGERRIEFVLQRI